MTKTKTKAEAGAVKTVLKKAPKIAFLAAIGAVALKVIKGKMRT